MCFCVGNFFLFLAIHRSFSLSFLLSPPPFLFLHLPTPVFFFFFCQSPGVISKVSVGDSALSLKSLCNHPCSLLSSIVCAFLPSSLSLCIYSRLFSFLLSLFCLSLSLSLSSFSFSLSSHFYSHFNLFPSLSSVWQPPSSFTFYFSDSSVSFSFPSIPFCSTL